MAVDLQQMIEDLEGRAAKEGKENGVPQPSYGGAENGGTSGGGVTTINSNGGVSTDHRGGHTTAYEERSDGTKITTVRDLDGRTLSSIRRPNGDTVYITVEASGETKRSTEHADGSKEGTRTDASGNVVQAWTESSTGRYESVELRPNNSRVHFVKEGTREVTTTTNAYGHKEIYTTDENQVHIRRFDESGEEIYRGLFDRSGNGKSWEMNADGESINLSRTSTVTNNWFGNGRVTEIEEIKTITDNEGHVRTSRSVTRVETAFGDPESNQPGMFQRAGEWLNDTIKDTWEQLTNDKAGDVPKIGITDVTVDGQQHRLAITIGTALNDILYAGGVVSGGNGSDTLNGQGDQDILLGGSDHDILIGGNGADHLDGGAGFDLASYEQSTSGVTASLSNPSQNTGEAWGDIYSSIEGITGSTYKDHLMGDAAANALIGLLGNDVLMGFDGNDVLRGGLGADALDGGGGFDIASYAEAMGGVTVNLTDATRNTGEALGDVYNTIEGLIGSSFSDILIGNGLSNRLEGNDGADVLDGGDGRNTLSGGAGNDLLYSGADADVLGGGDGFDKVSYYNRLTAVQIYLWDVSKNIGASAGDIYIGVEVIDGTRFDDVLEGDGEANTFWGDAGHDRMKGGAGADTLSGGDGDDKLEGGTDADALNGGNGRDTASYAGAVTGVGVYLHTIARNSGDAAGDTFASIEVIDGSTHSDTLEGNGSSNAFWGDAGHDALKGFAGTDTLSGGAGDDRLFGGEGADVLDGGEGYDFASYADAASGVLVDLLNTSRNTGEAAGDVYASIEGVEGSAHGDQLYGTNGSDDFHGGAGDDQLEGRGGADQLVGGDGFDFAVYWGASSGVIANLTAGYGTQGDAAGDRFYGIEGLQGSHHADTLTGDGKANTLYGWGGNDLLLGDGDVYAYGNDYIEGGDGADTISGGGGHDWLLGNAGRDVFRFDARLSIAGVDTLADFNAAEDRIALETSVFGFARVTYDAWGSPVNGTLSASAFKVGTSASASAQRIVYDQASGALFFDADGVGGAAQVLFAKVAAGTALSAGHFQLFSL